MGPAPRVVGASNLEAPVGWIQFDFGGIVTKMRVKMWLFFVKLFVKDEPKCFWISPHGFRKLSTHRWAT